MRSLKKLKIFLRDPHDPTKYTSGYIYKKMKALS